MREDTHRACQLCARPLPVIEPHIRKAANVGHDIQAEVDDQVMNSTGAPVLFQVAESCEKIIQIAPAKVIEDTDESNTGIRSNITDESGHKNTMIWHKIVAWLAIGVTTGTHIIDDGIAIILNL